MAETMARFLFALQNQASAGGGGGGGGESLLGSIKIAVLPIVKVFTMCFLGFLMASKYVNILPASGRKLLNGVCVCVYMQVACVLNWNCTSLTHSLTLSLFCPLFGFCS